MLLEPEERHMSFDFRTTLLLTLALPLAACSDRTNSASRSPDDTLRDGTPPGDHTASDPANPHADPSSAADGSAVGDTGPGARDGAPAAPSGGTAEPNGASPRGIAGP
jgi:hypothetical protein